ncbi:MAG TPA: DnaB-like helicase C-terminal domain-containing protein [Saccharofermentans sp.]|nr:DnaB-like helicase C-terminal domain-containing protein [Saccharofermentans sp.]
MAIELDPSVVEKLILKKFYTDSDFFDLIANNFDARIFENQNIAVAVKVLLAYHKKYDKFPKTDTYELILQKYVADKEMDWLAVKNDVHMALNIIVEEDEEFVKDNVLSHIKGKLTYHAIIDNLEKIQQYRDMSSCMTLFEKISSLGLDNGIGMDYFKDFERHLEELAIPDQMTPTLLTDLDKELHGGLSTNGRAVYFFVAQPGLGKSLMLSNIAVNFLKQNKFVAILSLEMSEYVYTKRIDAHLSSIDVNQLHQNIDELKVKVGNFEQLYPGGKLLIKEFPPDSINPATISNYVKNVQMKYGRKIDLLVVDYLNLLNPNGGSKGLNSYEKVGQVAKEIRALTYKYSFPALSASQLNRSGYNTNTAGMGEISDSSQIAMTADFIATLWQAEGDKEASKMNSTIIKNRFGFCGKTLNFFINYTDLTISDYTATRAEEADGDNILLSEVMNLMK